MSKYNEKTIINLHDYYYKVTGKKSNRHNGHHDKRPIIGVDYLPPFNTNITNRIKAKKRLYESILLPDSFSWIDENDISLRNHDLSDNLPGNITITPGNQLYCGSCWAWTSTGAFSDRIAVITGRNPNLGASYILSCSLGPYCDQEDLNGCNGGVLDMALVNMSDTAGSVPDRCWNYDWCSNNQSCSDGEPNPSYPNVQDYNNTLAPNFSKNKGICVSVPGNPAVEIYKIKQGSVSLFSVIQDVKNSIYLHGPLPTGFTVYGDFVLGTSSDAADGWANTGGIYVHLDRNINTRDPYPYSYAPDSSQDEEIGGHAAVIVGWGEATIDNFLTVSMPGQSTITLPFWIARNSWSTDWNENGYFRIAMSNSTHGINTNTYFDAMNSSQGGPIDFQVDTDLFPPPSEYYSEPINYKKLVLIILGGVAIIVFLVLIFRTLPFRRQTHG